MPRPITILDIGGTQQFWEVMGFTNYAHVHVTLLNLRCLETKYPNFTGSPNALSSGRDVPREVARRLHGAGFIAELHGDGVLARRS
jgi:hypothetical protein